MEERLGAGSENMQDQARAIETGRQKGWREKRLRDGEASLSHSEDKIQWQRNENIYLNGNS